MKKIATILIFSFVFSTSVFAFMPQMNFFLNREVATARIINNWGRPLVCSGVTNGQTYRGIPINFWFNNIYVYPGSFVDTYVYSNFYDPFINVWAQVDCQFTW